MAIRQEAYEKHFISRPQEHLIAGRLGDTFDVTYGDRHLEFSFWFAAPSRPAKERFGLSEEVLVIYSEHATTDGRVLRAINELRGDNRYRHRLDPVLFILIHNGDPDDTRELVKADPDRVIVPFLAAELLDKTKGPLFIRNRIAEDFGSVDLFGMSSPLKSDQQFFGRETLVQELVVRASLRGENSGVFGLRKTGKTSVLRAVERRTASRPILAEYFDCQGPGIHSARWWQVLENIADRLQSKLQLVHRRTARITLDYTELNAGVRFSTDIQSILRDGELDRVLLMLDEVEFITPGISGQLGQHWDSDFVPFWQTIRSTHQETEGRLVFLVAGVNPSSVQEPRFAEVPNPIFQLAPPHFLDPFTQNDVRAMVRSIGRYSGLNFDEQVYEYLRDKYGGHPFLIRIACSEVWKHIPINDSQKRTVVNIAEFETRNAEIRSRLTLPIKDILLSLVWWYPEEYDLLQILAAGDTAFVADYVKSNPDSLVQFARYGVLVEGGSSQFAIEDIRDFLVQRGEEYKTEISPFRRGDYPPQELPEVPDLATLSNLFQNRCEVEIKLRRTIMIYIGLKENWDKRAISESIVKGLRSNPQRRDPGALFIGREPKDVMNQLYLADLHSIMGRHWDMFGPLFDGNKGRCDMNLETINKARQVEAHTKPFSPGEIQEFNNSYDWVLQRVNKVPGIDT